jgi:DNA replication protein DnaC
LFRDLNLARADGSLRQLLKRLNRIEVLVIDDWAMAPMAESERRDFWEIAENRYQTRSMILTSQLPAARWHEQIGDPTLNDKDREQEIRGPGRPIGSATCPSTSPDGPGLPGQTGRQDQGRLLGA